MPAFPYYRQRTLYTCGPASLKAVLEFHGTRVSEKKLESLLKTHPEKGTPRSHMIRVAKQFGFAVDVLTDAYVQDLRPFVQKGIPAIVRFLEPLGDEHYAIVTGVDRHTVTLSDPYHGPKVQYSRAEFARRWKGRGHRGWAMAVRKKES